MRIRRATPQKPLTEDQKARAIEAQKHVQQLNGWPLTANQVYQNYPAAAPTMASRFQDNMRKNPFMRNRMTFEEKYWVLNNTHNEWTVIEESALQTINTQEDTVVPPSLEEDSNQTSPLPPGVVNASEVSDLDAYIKEAEKLQQEGVYESQNIPATESAGVNRDIYENMDLKGLKEVYASLWGTRDISHNNNKKSIINLIIDLESNGSQEKEEQWNSDPATTIG